EIACRARFGYLVIVLVGSTESGSKRRSSRLGQRWHIRHCFGYMFVLLRLRILPYCHVRGFDGIRIFWPRLRASKPCCQQACGFASNLLTVLRRRNTGLKTEMLMFERLSQTKDLIGAAGMSGRALRPSN